MKKIFILSILFAMVSCNEPTVDKNIYHKVEMTNDVYIVDKFFEFKVVIIDSCEYLISSRYESSKGFGYMSHKGNCKYCAERRKRELQNLK